MSQTNWIKINNVQEIPKNTWVLIKLNWCGKPTITLASFDKKNIQISRIGNIGGCFLMDLRDNEMPTHYMLIPEY